MGKDSTARPPRSPGGRWEVAVAILGALSSVLLAALAFAPSNDPELAGRTAFAKLAGDVEDAVAAEWERALADSGFAVGDRMESWSRADEALVAQRALHHNAAALVLFHNHPSGNAEPSPADRTITRRLKEALGLLDIRILDHLVIGGLSHTSMAARGWV